MPFTFSHPAVVLPLNYLNKRWLSLTALVTGSMTPDFEYFIRMREYTLYSHTWTGIFWYDLPLAMLLAFVFHNLVRTRLILFSPYAIRRRLWRYRNFNWNKRFADSWFIVVSSFLIGIISHLLLDRFTHKTVRLINKLTPLQDQNTHSGYHQVTYFLFWDINSLIGMILVLYAIWQLPVEKTIVRGTSISVFWLTTILLSIFVLLIRFLVFGDFSIPNAVVSGIGAFLLSLLLSCIVFRKPKQAHA